MRQHVALGGLCYEPFCGSGSQIRAGGANGRRVFAMECRVKIWRAELARSLVFEDRADAHPLRTWRERERKHLSHHQSLTAR